MVHEGRRGPGAFSPRGSCAESVALVGPWHFTSPSEGPAVVASESSPPERLSRDFRGQSERWKQFCDSPIAEVLSSRASLQGHGHYL